MRSRLRKMFFGLAAVFAHTAADAIVFVSVVGEVGLGVRSWAYTTPEAIFGIVGAFSHTADVEIQTATWS